MRVLFDDPSLEASLEEMTDAVVAAVESHRVQAVQSMHPSREVGLIRADQQVKVIRHQCPGVELPPVTKRHLPEEAHPGVGVEWIENDRSALDAS